ncbi:MAG: hypothetical protein WD638_07300 [Nitriliruptoraceae bacterium]
MAETATAKTTAKKTATKKSAPKKATAKTTAKKTAAKRTAAKKSAPKRATPPPTPRLSEREPREVLEVVGYAAAAVASDVVDRARELPTRMTALRSELEKVGEDAPQRFRSLGSEAPAKLSSRFEKLRKRVTADTERALSSLEREVVTRADRGRHVIEEVREDERVARILDQTAATRSQVKAAITSVRRTGDVAAEAAGEQAKTATSQVKAAATSARKSADTIADAVSE